MATINMADMDLGSGGQYAESPQERQAWVQFRKYLAGRRVMQGQTIWLKGYIKEFILNNGAFFVQDVTKDDGTEGKWRYLKAVAVITDPEATSFPLSLPPKNVGASFFDGVTPKGRTNNRGGMYRVHLAVTHEEPSEELKQNRGSWNTDDYTGPDHPIMVGVAYEGLEAADSKYAGRRANLRVFCGGFERDPDAAPGGNELDDLGDLELDIPADLLSDDVEPEPAPRPKASTSRPSSTAGGRNTGRSRPAPEPDNDDGFFDSLLAQEPPKNRAVANDPAAAKATERQVKFIYAIGREAGLDEQELTQWSQELYGQDPSQLNRRDASSLIEALQRRRNEVA